MADALFQLLNNWGAIGELASISSHSADANNDGVAWVFQANTADPITHLGFRYGARTGTPPTYSMRLEGVGTDGLPDNADIGGGSATAKTFTPPADTTWNGTWRWIELTNPFTPTRGQMLASTIRYSSGTIDASNFSSFSYTWTGIRPSSGFPYPLLLTAGTWAKNAGASLFGYRTANGRYGIIGISEYTTNISTAGNRQAMHFTLPSGHGSTFKVLGMRAVNDMPTTGTTIIFGLWDAAGTAIQSVTIDSDHVRAPGSIGTQEFYFDETTLTALNFGTKYYIGYEIVGSDVGLRGVTLGEAADRSWAPNGVNMGLGIWNGSSWADTDTVLPQASLILADITEPAGSTFQLGIV